MNTLLQTSRPLPAPARTPFREETTDLREALLSAAFQEISLRGFQAAGLNAILARAGVTKGALYHYFRNKEALGLAVVDERVRERVVGIWLRSLETCDDTVDALKAGLSALSESATEDSVMRGCLLENLATEMSPVSEAFRERIRGVYRDWRALVRRALERGKKRDHVGRNVPAGDEAMMFVATLQGCMVLAKNECSIDTYRAGLRILGERLDALRA